MEIKKSDEIVATTEDPFPIKDEIHSEVDRLIDSMSADGNISAKDLAYSMPEKLRKQHGEGSLFLMIDDYLGDLLAAGKIYVAGQNIYHKPEKPLFR